MGEPEAPVVDSIGYRLKQVQSLLRARMDGALRDIGLTTPQYAALSALEELPAASNAELARRCFVTAQTMHDILHGLTRAGLIERRQHPTHGRAIQTYLTAQGGEALAAAHRRVLAVEQRMIAPLPSERRAELLAALAALAEALEPEA